MTYDQFKIPFEKFLRAYGENMDEQRVREIWVSFQKHDPKLIADVLDFIEGCDSFFPKNPKARINDVVRYFIETHKWKPAVESTESEPVNRNGMRHLHRAIDELKQRVENGEVPVVNTAALNTPGWKNMKSIAQVLVQFYDYQYVQPAIRDFVSQRENLPREPRPVSELSKDGNRFLCYYCFSKLTSLYDREQLPKIVPSGVYECPKCKITYGEKS